MGENENPGEQPETTEPKEETAPETEPTEEPAAGPPAETAAEGQGEHPAPGPTADTAPAEEGRNAPDGLYYTKNDEWIRVEGATGTVGITDFAQHALGDIVDLELPEPGSALKAGGRAGAIESVKAVADLFSPVSGTVTEVNSALPDNPDSIKADAYSAWMYKLELTDPGEINSLMDAAAYRGYLEDRPKH